MPEPWVVGVITLAMRKNLEEQSAPVAEEGLLAPLALLAPLVDWAFFTLG